MVHTSARRPIRLLPPHVANQIAAGEVIERPASVVKELMENAIDAAARNIDVEVEQGGVALIRVRDDGCGIARDDLSLALAPHATSKLQSSDDLITIASLGFRGEALASIASVSRLTLSSRTSESDEGWRLSGDGETLQPVPHPVGTSVEMRDLFFNTPARRKFLRTGRTEFLHIEEVVKRLALSHFDIGFTLQHNGRRIFRLRPASDHNLRQQRIQLLLGKPFLQQSIELDFEAGGLRLWGWLLPPEMSRSQADTQFFYLNGRVVRDRLVTHGVRKAFGEEVPAGRYPAYLLYLEMDPGQVDVNVHPTKHEVRFREARTVHDFLLTTLNRMLSEASTMEDGVSPLGHSAPGYRPEPLRPAMGIAECSSHDRQCYEVNRGQQKRGERFGAAHLGKAVTLLHGRYILAVSQEGPLLVDALMARQRVVLHYLQQADAEEGTRGRPLLIPLTLRLDPKLVAVTEQSAEIVNRLGFVIQPLSEESVVVRQIPSVLEGLDIGALTTNLLEQLATGCEQDDVLQEQLAGQIQMDPGQAMSLDEVDRLLRQFEMIEPALNRSTSPSVWRVLDQAALARFLNG
jgi:DNA mismatch repair protein MutL